MPLSGTTLETGLRDELTWIRRLGRLHHRKQLAMGLFRSPYLEYSVRHAEENDRYRGPALVDFLTPPPRRDTTTSSEIAVNLDAPPRARLTMNSNLLALVKTGHDDDRLKAE
jgi:hypothetical protein